MAVNVLCDTTDINADIVDINSELENISELTRSHIESNASSARNQEAFQQRYNELLSCYDEAKTRLNELFSTKERRKARHTMLIAFTETMERTEDMLTEFDESLWQATVENVTVFADGRTVFKFMNGVEIDIN